MHAYLVAVVCVDPPDGPNIFTPRLSVNGSPGPFHQNGAVYAIGDILLYFCRDYYKAEGAYSYNAPAPINTRYYFRFMCMPGAVWKSDPANMAPQDCKPGEYCRCVQRTIYSTRNTLG